MIKMNIDLNWYKLAKHWSNADQVYIYIYNSIIGLKHKRGLSKFSLRITCYIKCMRYIYIYTYCTSIIVICIIYVYYT